MVELGLDADRVINDLLKSWYEIDQKLKLLKTKEILLRKQIFGLAFPEPKEGVNNYPLPDSYMLKGEHVLNRKVDFAAFTAIKDEMRELNVNPDKLVRLTPELVKREYNKLDDKEKMTFEQCLIIKPGTPKLIIVKPKR